MTRRASKGTKATKFSNLTFPAHSIAFFLLFQTPLRKVLYDLSRKSYIALKRKYFLFSDDTPP